MTLLRPSVMHGYVCHGSVPHVHSFCHVAWTEDLEQSVLELSVLDQIDKRIDAAIGEDRHDAEVIKRGIKAHGHAHVVDEEKRLIPHPTEDETDAD